MTIKELLGESYREGMTVEEIEEALAGVTFPTDVSGEVERLTKLLTKANSEAAEYKRQLRERMSEDEKRAEEDAEKQKKYDEMLRKVSIGEHKAKLLALGYDESLATETAEAMVDNDLDKVVANQKIHVEAIEKRLRDEALNKTPRPGGGGKKAMTVDEIMKISDPVERQAAIADNIELFD